MRISLHDVLDTWETYLYPSQNVRKQKAHGKN